MFSSITAFFEMIKSYFNLKEKSKEKQLETGTMKEYSKLVKACKYAEEAFMYLEKHGAIDFDTYKQQRRYETLVNKFRNKVI